MFAERNISVLAFCVERERMLIVDVLARGHPACTSASWLVDEAVGYLDRGLAYSTSKSYASGVNRLRSFAEAYETNRWHIRWWEPDSALIVLFMAYIIGQVSDYYVERCWRGIKRSKKKEKDVRLTLTLDLLIRVVSYVVTFLVSVMVWGVVGLFRVGELVVSGPKHCARILRRAHCTLMEDDGNICLRVVLDGSKTDPFRVGLKRGSAQAMFRWSNGTAVSRETFVTHARALLVDAGIAFGKDFNGISLRRGGAKSLKLAGASDLTIMRAGRWSSDCFKKYVETSRFEILQEQRYLLDLTSHGTWQPWRVADIYLFCSVLNSKVLRL
eukprot:g70802.t1